ncbi:MAG: cell division protein ZapA [Alphaproteobacteria bacterium]|nr:cell division protein ZapA [Alphaproteobacteria bacterium]
MTKQEALAAESVDSFSTEENSAPESETTKVTISLLGRDYIVACGKGEEDKLAHLVSFVEGELNGLSRRNPSASETRLFMLTCLLLADALLETRKAALSVRHSDEALMVAAVDHLRQRLENIMAQIKL